MTKQRNSSINKLALLFMKIALVGSSTGGIDALLTILRGFPQDCPPTVIVQHTGAPFGASLAELLDTRCAAKVRLASGRQALEQGSVYLGAGINGHLTIQGDCRLFVSEDGCEPVSGHRPSIDVLFESAAPIAPRVVAALLTGMGKDGAVGLKKLRENGAHTIAQDEATSVVFGMPRAAVELGAACEVLPLHKIGPALLEPVIPSTRLGALK